MALIDHGSQLALSGLALFILALPGVLLNPVDVSESGKVLNN